MTLDRDDGFVRVVARADNHLVLGIQAVGAGISELSAAFALALEMGACLEDIAGTIHAHPTQGEGFRRRPSRRSATPSTSERGARSLPRPAVRPCGASRQPADERLAPD